MAADLATSWQQTQQRGAVYSAVRVVTCTSSAAVPWALSARQHDSQRAAHMPATVYDLHSALVAVTGSSRVRERRSLAQDLRGGSERRKVWLLLERQPLERGHEPDEALDHIIGPRLGCVLVNLSAHVSDQELCHL